MQPYVTSQALAARLGQFNPDAAPCEAKGLDQAPLDGGRRAAGLRLPGWLHAPEVSAADEIRLVRTRQAGALSMLARITYAERFSGDASGSVALWLAVEEMERTRYLPWRSFRAHAFKVEGAGFIEQVCSRFAVWWPRQRMRLSTRLR